ncbi:MAG: hypothetical protein JXR96_19665 [Deltaproteobacteria bacterium]|nr:hypothetical protein [Deltaproteobacteria bacterium]
MEAIEQVIAQSRLGSGRARKRQFTLDRERAVEKMRRFALAEPCYYVLELIQAAVANGATSIDVQIEEDNLCFAWTGGGLRAADIARLFDFLFASKDRIELSHLRELALGINALLLFEPDEIDMLSGDGSLVGTTAMVLRHGREDTLEVGPADRAVCGTWIWARGLKRKKVSRLGQHACGEHEAIETRCLALPVPLLLDGSVPFGRTPRRLPIPFGYSPCQSFDEGDLYGTLGVCVLERSGFRLLTHGVWIQTVEMELVPGKLLGGVVNFDRLRKTADHSAIVQDSVFEEMQLRLRPYARRLLFNVPQADLHEMRLLDGESIPAKTLASWLRAQARIVLVPQHVQWVPDKKQLALAIGKALVCPVVACPEGAREAVRRIAAECVQIVEPELDDEELGFFAQAPALPPPEPWLVCPRVLSPTPVSHLPASLAEPFAARQSTGRIEACLYAPVRAQSRTSTWVRIETFGRVAWQAALSSPYPGQVVVIRVPDAAPLAVARIGAELARHVLRRCRDEQAELAGRALANMAKGGLERSQAALALVCADAMVRLAEGGPADRLWVRIDPLSLDPLWLERPMLRTLDGSPQSLRQVQEALSATGMVYGSLPEVPPDSDGLDRSQILALSPWQERLLLGLLGEAAYVRVDGRDVLAREGGVVCRDIAWGLRPFRDDFPLLAEGADPAALALEERERVVCGLTRSLIDCFLDRPSYPLALRAATASGQEENRRHACRHLQYLVLRGLEHASPTERKALLSMGVLDLNLFADIEGRPVTARALIDALENGDELSLAYAGGLDSELLGRLGSQTGSESHFDLRSPIAASPWLAMLLHGRGRLRAAWDFDLGEGVIGDSGGKDQVLSAPVVGPDWHGEIGLCSEADARAAVMILDERNRPVDVLTGSAARLGLSGYVRLVEGGWSQALRQKLVRAVERTVATLVERGISRASEGEEADRALVRMLLAHVTGHLHFTRDPHGAVVPELTSSQVQDAAALALISDGEGGRLSIWQLVEEFCAFSPGRRPKISRALACPANADLAPLLRELVDDARVAHPPSAPLRRAQDETACLGLWLGGWLHELRSDRPERAVRVLLVTPEQQSEDEDWLGEDLACYREQVMDVPGEGCLYVNERHALLVRIVRGEAGAEDVAWLLLALYAHLNESQLRVSNEHELAFQARVFEALERGQLDPVSIQTGA